MVVALRAYGRSRSTRMTKTRGDHVRAGRHPLQCGRAGGVITGIGGQMLSLRVGNAGAAMFVTSRRATPEALAATITWLLSPDAGNVNGAVVTRWRMEGL